MEYLEGYYCDPQSLILKILHKFEPKNCLKLKVVVNGQEIVIFRGARVQDAVRAFSEESCRLLMKGVLIAFDRFGNRTDPDGELSEGQVINLKDPTNSGGV